ncbi:MAG: 50S ribosomal protein L18 [Bacteroidales bacterium]|nr:50S ribosomal protein L18 [Bacteroidales bacterium]
MAIKNKKQYRRFRIKMRIRKHVSGTYERPRMSVFRSNKGIYVQLIDDFKGVTILTASSRDEGMDEKKTNKVEQARRVGETIAKKAVDAGIQSVVFDRNGYLYHGRVKALAEAAREGGLKF